MESITLFLVKLLSISAALLGLYAVAFKGKASFISQRIMLLSIPLVSLLFASLSYNLVAIDAPFQQRLETPPAFADGLTDDILDSNEVTERFTPEGFRIIRASGQEAETHEAKEQVHALNITPQGVTYSLWGVVSLLLLLLFARRIYQVCVLRRISEREERDGYTLYTMQAGDMIFSFWRGVYIHPNILGDKLHFVLRHEVSHIQHRHYVDKLLMEIYTLLFWFNPVVWYIRQELGLIQEYEADHAVLESGCESTQYKMYLFEEVTAQAPTFANGLNSSQIKKRFIMMKQGYSVRHRILRSTLTVATLFALSLSSLVYVQAKPTSNSLPADTPNDVENLSLETGVSTALDNNNGESDSKVRLYKGKGFPYINPEYVEKIYVDRGKKNVKVVFKQNRGLDRTYHLGNIPVDEVKSAGIKSQVVCITKTNGEIWASTDGETWQKRAPSIVAKRSQYYVARDGEKKDIYVVRSRRYTKVYIRFNVVWDSHWFVLAKNAALIDPVTNDRYMAYSAKDNLPLGIVTYIRGEKKEVVYLEMTFPPLDKEVERVTFKETIDPNNTIGWNASLQSDGWLFKNVKVEDDEPYFVSKKYQERVERDSRTIMVD